MRTLLTEFSSSHVIVEDDQELLVSSGNVFGAINLWACPLDLGEVTKIFTAPPQAVLESHEGVIFKTRWNKDKSKLLSVADDRTVRVFDLQTAPIKEVLVGWGHISRVWDAIFIESECSQTISSQGLVASSSEDGSIRIWDITTNGCLACMRGHSADVWRLCTTSGGATLLSGGNDGAVKVWDILSQLSANPAEASSSLLEYKFADWKALQETQPVEECRFDGYNSETHADKIASTTLRESKVVIDGGEGGRKNQTRRLNGTSGLRVSADHKHMLLVLCSGTVWMINKHESSQPA